MPTKKELLEALEEELKIRNARSSYLEYVKYTNPGYIASKFHTYLANEVEHFMNTPSSEAVDILLLSVPPQHGKSHTITETLAAWYLGKNPNKSVIIAGYNEDFAIRFGRRNREKIAEYNSKIFPECVLADAPNSNVEFETTKKGRCISRGILSGITGNSAHLFIIDDPIKNRQEADSERTRAAIWNEYLNSVKTRMAPGGKLIVIATRWHEEDLIGMIQLTRKDVRVINLPVECDDPENDPLGRKLGEALCPEIGRGQAWLEDFKKDYTGKEGSRAWSALYQGKPNIAAGNMVLKEWWQYYTSIDIDTIPITVMSVDATFKDGDNNDFVSIGVIGKKDEKYYLLDDIHAHLSFTATLDAIRLLNEQYPNLYTILVEDKANGSAIINTLTTEINKITPINPQGGKVSRAAAVSPIIERGDVLLPMYEGYTKETIDEWAKFPNGSHDDRVDMMSQAINYLMTSDATYTVPITKKTRKWSQDMFEDYEHADEKLQEQLISMWGYPNNENEW